MAKPIETYRYKESRLEILPYFLYEVDIYKITSNTVSILKSKYYTSNKFIDIKKRSKVIKRCKDYIIQRFITFVGAPASFIKENNLPIYQLNKKKNEKRTR